MKKFCFLLFILVFFTPFVFAQEDVDTSSDIPFSTAPKIVQALEAKHKGLCPYCKKDQTPICVCDEEPQYFVCCPFCRKILESIEAEPDPLPPPSQKEIDRAIKSLSRRWQQYFDAVVANDFKKIAEFAHPDILNANGGSDKFSKIVKEANENLEGSGIFLSKTRFTEPFAPNKIGSIWVSRVVLETPVLLEGMKGVLRAFSFAVSENGIHWYFIESNKSGRDFFKSKYGCATFVDDVPNAKVEFVGTKQFWVNEENVWKRYNLSPEEQKAIPQILSGYIIHQHENSFLAGASDLPSFKYVFEAASLVEDDLLGLIPTGKHFFLLTTNTRFTNKGQFQLKAKWVTQVSIKLNQEAGGFIQDFDVFVEVP